MSSRSVFPVIANLLVLYGEQAGGLRRPPCQVF
jgi:hypothetical protein